MPKAQAYSPRIYTQEHIELALGFLLEGYTTKDAAAEAGINSRLAAVLRRGLVATGALPEVPSAIYRVKDIKAVWKILEANLDDDFAEIAKKSGFAATTVKYFAEVGRMAGEVKPRKDWSLGEELVNAAVDAVLKDGSGTTQAAQELGVSSKIIRDWLKKAGFMQHARLMKEREQVWALVKTGISNADIMEATKLSRYVVEGHIEVGFRDGDLKEEHKRKAKGGHNAPVADDARAGIIAELTKQEGTLSLQAIAKKYGVGKSTVSKIARTLDKRQRPRALAANAKQGKFRLVREAALEMLKRNIPPSQIIADVKTRFQIDVNSAHISRWKTARDRAEGKLVGYRKPGNPGKTKPPEPA